MKDYLNMRIHMVFSSCLREEKDQDPGLKRLKLVLKEDNLKVRIIPSENSLLSTIFSSFVDLVRSGFISPGLSSFRGNLTSRLLPR